jgi:hypothetical protein
MGTMLHDVYIAGHFWKKIVESLNWQVLNKQGIRDKRSRRIIRQPSGTEGESQAKTPSWSWASMDGPLNQSALVRPFLFSSAFALSYTLIPLDSTNPTGDVAFASLDIEAHCTEIEWKDKQLVGPPQLETSRFNRFTINWDDPDDEPKQLTKFFIATLFTTATEANMEGLVLKLVVEKEQNLYRRMGHFKCQDDEWWLQEWQIITLI